MNWIKISSEKDLPPVSDNGASNIVVACVNYLGRGQMAVAMYLDGGVWYYLESKKPIGRDFNVTHWHPFLEPPNI